MIAIIPARKNSKGLKKKNILSINNKPLISYSIQQALKSKFISEIIVSTDCREIKRISQKYGANVPFLRPKYLATDKSDAIYTYRYTINKLEKIKKIKIKNFIVLLPTSPLRKVEDIDNAIKLFHKKKADSVVSITEASFPISWNLKFLKKNQLLKKYFNNYSLINNRQKQERSYIPNGSIYIFSTRKILSKKDYYFKKTFGYLMPNNRSIDIDNEFEFNLAKYLMKEGF